MATTSSEPFDPTRKVIDHRYVVFTTQYGTHLLSGSAVPVSLKGRLLHINAEPTLEKGQLVINKTPVEVWLPKVILRDEGDKNHLYHVIYDPHFRVTANVDEQEKHLIDEAILRPNAWDPISRT